MLLRHLIILLFASFLLCGVSCCSAPEHKEMVNLFDRIMRQREPDFQENRLIAQFVSVRPEISGPFLLRTVESGTPLEKEKALKLLLICLNRPEFGPGYDVSPISRAKMLKQVRERANLVELLSDLILLQSQIDIRSGRGCVTDAEGRVIWGTPPQSGQQPGNLDRYAFLLLGEIATDKAIDVVSAALKSPPRPKPECVWALDNAYFENGGNKEMIVLALAEAYREDKGIDDEQRSACVHLFGQILEHNPGKSISGEFVFNKVLPISESFVIRSIGLAGAARQIGAIDGTQEYLLAAVGFLLFSSERLGKQEVWGLWHLLGGHVKSDMPGLEEIDLPEVLTWWLQRREFLPAQPLPKEWSEADILTQLVETIESVDKFKGRCPDSIVKARKLIANLKQQH